MDDIEHGILRKYGWKYSLGYLPEIFPSKLIKQLAVTNLDYKIHFALNCGAKSCPPIAFYKYPTIYDQLDVATTHFLKAETQIDTIAKIIYTSKILKWYQGDFGGIKGIKLLISKISGQPVRDYQLKFKEYDWSENLKNYQ